ncbi:MAG: hypothetical protein ACXVCP_10375 [Bdellovibrio sp.]
MKARYFLFTFSFIALSTARAAFIPKDKLEDKKPAVLDIRDNIRRTKTGQMMALTKDVVFIQTESAVLLASHTTTVPDIRGKNIDFDVFCQIERQEQTLRNKENNCADFPKTKITKDIFYHIKSMDWDREYPAYELIQFETSVTKNQCIYTFRFECGTGPQSEPDDFFYYSNISSSMRTILSSEVESLASKFIKIKDDPSAPIPWP